MTAYAVFLAPIAAAAALLFALLEAVKIKNADPGQKLCQEIASAIRTGASLFEKTVQKRGHFLRRGFVLLFLLAQAGYLSIFVPLPSSQAAFSQPLQVSSA